MAIRPFQPHLDVRIERSSPWCFAAALESVARARSTPLRGRAKPLDPTRAFKWARVRSTPSGARNCRSCPFGSAFRSTWPLDPFGSCSSPLRFAGLIEVAGRVCSVLGEQLNRLLAFGFLGTLDFVVIKSCATSYLRTLCPGRESL